MSPFPLFPYRHSYYGDMEPLARSVDDETAALVDLVEGLKRGNFAANAEHLGLLTSSRPDIRLYAADVLAATCSHANVGLLRRAWEAAEDEREIRRLIVVAGHTLSPAAVAELERMWNDCDCADYDEYFVDAVTTILNPETVRALGSPSAGFWLSCREHARNLSGGAFYLEGGPVFIGDITKRLVSSAVVALRSGNTFGLSFEAALFQDFTGFPLPMSFGSRVTKDTYAALLACVTEAARQQWERGMKYFYGHPVPLER